MKYWIFIVEDDKTLAELLAVHLRKWDYEVYCVQRFDNIMSEFEEIRPQLVIMDISLPFYSGFHWCQEIRRIAKLPILFLSSTSDNMNQIMAMNMGADDFVVKPFDLAVLTAKISALLRRSYDFQDYDDSIRYNNVLLKRQEMILEYRKQKIELTKNEFRILEMLLLNSGEVISRKEIVSRLWESENYIDDNTLSVNMTRLRKKLASYGLNNFIETKKGQGYIIV